MVEKPQEPNPAVEQLPYYGAEGGQAAPSEQTCDDAEFLENRWAMPDGLYINVEQGEGPASYF